MRESLCRCVLCKEHPLLFDALSIASSHAQTYTYTHIHTYAYTCTCTLYAYIYIKCALRKYGCTHAPHTCMQSLHTTHTHTHTHTHTQTHIHTHTHTHTHTHKRLPFSCKRETSWLGTRVPGSPHSPMPFKTPPTSTWSWTSTQGGTSSR